MDKFYPVDTVTYPLILPVSRPALQSASPDPLKTLLRILLPPQKLPQKLWYIDRQRFFNENI